MFYNPSMQEVECRAVTPKEIINELQGIVKQRQENKYAFQVGLQNLDFEIDEEKVQELGVALPFLSIDQAERALRERVIRPATLVEADNIAHQVLAFDPQPVGYSGFMDCVTHSVALTDRGLFEVGRFPAMNVSSQSRTWQWFLHRRLATSEQVTAWREDHSLSPDQLVKRCFEEMTGR